MPLWKTLLTFALCLGAPMGVLAQDPAHPANDGHRGNTHGIWHTESARILSRAGELDALTSRPGDGLVQTILRLRDVKRFADNPSLGREALHSEASRGNIAGVILLRKAGYEDPAGPEAAATATTYWQGLGSETLFFQTENFSRQGRSTDIHLGLHMPNNFLPQNCSVQSAEKFTCKSSPFELEVTFRQAWMQEVIDRMLPGSSREEPSVTVEDTRHVRSITMIGRKNASMFRVVVTGSPWVQAEVDDLADQIWQWLPQHSVTATGPVIGWILILFIVVLIILRLIPKPKKAIDDSYDVS